jgi:hypothetical protein
MTVDSFSAVWHDLCAMGFLLLGYGVAAAAFYSLIAKTAKMEPEFPSLASSLTRTELLVEPTVIDLTELYEKKAA